MHKLTLYSPLRDWKKGNMPIEPCVYLALGTHSEHNDQLLLSAELKYDSEIDYAVDGLIEELEEFRKTAKKELRTLQAKMLSK